MNITGCRRPPRNCAPKVQDVEIYGSRSSSTDFDINSHYAVVGKGVPNETWCEPPRRNSPTPQGAAPENAENCSRIVRSDTDAPSSFACRLTLRGVGEIPCGPRSSVDRALASEAMCAGSTPVGGTKHQLRRQGYS